MIAPTDGALVLIIDDEPANIHVLANALKERYELIFATSAARALEIVLEAEVDLILLDVVMPGLDGYQLLEKLKQQETTRLWLEVGKNVLYPVLGLLALVVFWRAFKRTSEDDIPLGVPLGDLGTDTNGAAAPGKNRNPNAPATVTVEVLNRLIRENPENLTQSIRTWMGGKSK